MKGIVVLLALNIPFYHNEKNVVESKNGFAMMFGFYIIGEVH